MLVWIFQRAHTVAFPIKTTVDAALFDAMHNSSGSALAQCSDKVRSEPDE